MMRNSMSNDCQDLAVREIRLSFRWGNINLAIFAFQSAWHLAIAAILLISVFGGQAVFAQKSTTTHCSVTIKAFGANGDGVSDDTVAIRKALASRCAVTGENLTYRVTSSIMLPDDTNLSQGTFYQDIPSNSAQQVLVKHGGKNLTVSNVRVNRGNTPRFGSIGSAAGIYVADATDVALTDVEVFGDGLGTGIRIERSRNVKLVRPYVHDMKWETSEQPENEVVVGIWSIQSSNVTIESAKVANLTPVAIEAKGGRAAGRRNNMTDGIDSSGTDGFVITDPEIWNVGEGIDMSGRYATKKVTIRGGNLHDIDSYCYKWAHVQGGIIQNSVATRCGLGGYVLAGLVTDAQLINNRAIDIGSNGKWTRYPPTGFAIMFGYDAMPSGNTIRDSEAIDNQPIRTMKFGFRSDRVVPSNKLINVKATGYVTAPAANF